MPRGEGIHGPCEHDHRVVARRNRRRSAVEKRLPGRRRSQLGPVDQCFSRNFGTPPGEGSGEVTLYAGQRKLTLKWSDLVEYGGNRASRGGLLPRGLRRVERIETSG